MPTWAHAILGGIHTCGTTCKTTCKTMLAHKLARVSGVSGRTWALGHMAHYHGTLHWPVGACFQGCIMLWPCTHGMAWKGMYGSRGSMWAWSDINTSQATAVECTCSRALRFGLQNLCIKWMKYTFNVRGRAPRFVAVRLGP